MMQSCESPTTCDSCGTSRLRLTDAATRRRGDGIIRHAGVLLPIAHSVGCRVFASKRTHQYHAINHPTLKCALLVS